MTKERDTGLLYESDPEPMGYYIRSEERARTPVVAAGECRLTLLNPSVW